MKSMTPGEERRSLEEFPLPTIVTEDDTYLPTRIAQIDIHILALEASLKALRGTRKEFLERALQVGALEDEYCRIEFRERMDRVLNVPLFRERYPHDFMTICNSQRRDLMREIDQIGSRIPLGVADALTGKDSVTALCEVAITRTPHVVRRRDPIIVMEG